MRGFLGGLALALALTHSAFAQASTIRLGAENSTVTSGLMDYLIPMFTQETGIQVSIESVSSTAALEGARDGKYDAIITANNVAESRFMAEGYGEQRYVLMSTNVVLIGPNHDPAGVLEESGDLNAVLTRLFRSGHRNYFITPGDQSAVDQKGSELWINAGFLLGNQSWYRKANSDSLGMLNMANELKGYAFIDRATLLKHNNSVDMKVVYARPPLAELMYSVLTTSVHKVSDVNRVDATKFAYWLTSQEGQQKIRSYTPANTIAYQPRANIIE